MKVLMNPDRLEWQDLSKRPEFDTRMLSEKVGKILHAVKEEGDIAIARYTELFDQINLDSIRVTKEEWEACEDQLDDELKRAIAIARKNIARFHEQQKELPKKVETMPGVICWRKSVPIEKVGLYIPGGSAPLFSTVLMLAVPAVIAGCKEVVLCSPPNRQGAIHPAILYAAKLAGVTSVFKVGGAQAIAAMAFGTETVPAVYKILGPGNQYVTRAKQMVNLDGIAIDMPAGPSEVLVCADPNANAEFTAADLLAQAEHGPDSQVVLVAFDQQTINKTLDCIEKQIATLPRKDIARKALANSLAVILDTKADASDFINTYAPEHLILAMDEAEQFSHSIINSGSVFLGHFTPESVGDYASGTNHTLPTGGFAKAYSGVSLDTYVKKITFQQLSEEGLKNLGPAVEKMAAAEQLEAHKNAVTVRLRYHNNT